MTIAGIDRHVKQKFFANDFNGLRADVGMGCEVARRQLLQDGTLDSVS
jgi:hypothetical protein